MDTSVHSSRERILYLNVEAILKSEWEDDEGNSVEAKESDRLNVLITTLMHEFGHALEKELRMEFNEQLIEGACADWESRFKESGEES